MPKYSPSCVSGSIPAFAKAAIYSPSYISGSIPAVANSAKYSPSSQKRSSSCIWVHLQLQEWSRIEVVELVVLKFVVLFGLLISAGTAEANRGKRFAKKVVATPPSHR